VIAGEGSLEGALKKDLENLGLEDSVTMMGRIDDPVRMLWALDVFAFPSLHEGLGIAMLEAMACSLAVVASRAGGITDAVEDGRSGILVAPANASGLAAAIARLAAERRTRETLGESARRRVIERFSISAMARDTLALYRVCLGRRGEVAARRI
jgi:glycosyltransferase involved in cell wall biosynthesis